LFPYTTLFRSSISTAKEFQVPIEKDTEDLYEIEYHIDQEKLNDDGALVAPVKKGDVIGTAELTYTGEDDYGYIDENKSSEIVDVVADEDVEKSNWFMIILGAIGDFFSQLFSSIMDTVKGWFN